MNLKEHAKNIAVGALTGSFLLFMIVGSMWLSENNLDWIITIPLAIILFLVAFWGIGFFVRLMIEDFRKK